jgi:hypothetical protein
MAAEDSDTAIRFCESPAVGAATARFFSKPGKSITSDNCSMESDDWLKNKNKPCAP